MFFSELIVEGVKQLTGVQRFSFGARDVAIYAPPDGRLELLVKVLSALLHPTTPDGTRPDLKEPGAKATRAALTMQLPRDQRVRLMRDFGSGDASLAKDDGTGRFQVVSSKASDIERMLAERLKLPEATVFDALYLCRLSDLPSRAGSPAIPSFGAPGASVPASAPAAPLHSIGAQSMVGVPPSGPVAAPASLLGLHGERRDAAPVALSADGSLVTETPDRPLTRLRPVAPTSGLTREQQQQRLEELRQRRKVIAEVRRLEYQLEGLQRQRFELDDRLRPVRDLDRKIEAAQRELASFDNLSDLEAGFAQKLDAFEATLQRQQEQLSTLDAEWSQKLQGVGAATALEPLYRDRLFVGGLAVGTLAFIAGAVFARLIDPSWWKLALLDIPGYGVVAYVMLRRVTALESGAERQRLESQQQEARQQHVERFERETRQVMDLLQRHRVDGRRPQELESLRETLEQRAAAQAQVQRLSEQRQTWVVDRGLNIEAIEQEVAQLDTQIRDQEEELALMAVSHVDTTQLDEEIAQIELALSSQPSLVGAAAQDRRTDTAAETRDPYPSAYGTGSRSAPGASQGPNKTKIGFLGETPAPRWCAGDDHPGGGRGFDGRPAGAYGGTSTGQRQSPGSAVVVDQSRALVDRAAAELGTEVNDLAARITPRVQQYVTAFSDKRYDRVSFGRRGELSLLEKDSSRQVPFLLLQGVDRDVAYLALRFSLIELLAKGHPWPFILLTPFAAMPELKHPMVAKVLTFLGGVTQVLHFTSEPVLAERAGTRIDV